MTEQHAPASPSAADDKKWYDSSGVLVLAGLITVLILVIFLVETLGKGSKNPPGLVPVLGAVSTLIAAVGGLVWGASKGKSTGAKQTAKQVLPVMKNLQDELAAGGGAGDATAGPVFESLRAAEPGGRVRVTGSEKQLTDQVNATIDYLNEKIK